MAGEQEVFQHAKQIEIHKQRPLRQQKVWLKKMEAGLAPFEQMLAHSEFLLGERPLFVDFDLFGMLENFLFSGHYSLPKSQPNLREWHRCMKTSKLAN